jgi:hypothetical protein
LKQRKQPKAFHPQDGCDTRNSGNGLRSSRNERNPPAATSALLHGRDPSETETIIETTTDAIRTQMLRDKATCEDEMGEHNVARNKRTQKARRREEIETQAVGEYDDGLL